MLDRPGLSDICKVSKGDLNTLAKDVVHIFTDGSASTKDGSGGWGAVLIFNGVEKTLSGCQWGTTVGRMEMQAIASAIAALKSFNHPVRLYTDSQYCANSLAVWWRGWQADNWTTSTGKPVKHSDLIKQIRDTVEGQDVKFLWIKGHVPPTVKDKDTGKRVKNRRRTYAHKYNDMADKLATTARREMVLAEVNHATHQS